MSSETRCLELQKSHGANHSLPHSSFRCSWFDPQRLLVNYLEAHHFWRLLPIFAQPFIVCHHHCGPETTAGAPLLHSSHTSFLSPHLWWCSAPFPSPSKKTHYSIIPLYLHQFYPIHHVLCLLTLHKPTWKITNTTTSSFAVCSRRPTLPGIAEGGPPFPSATSLGSRTSITKGSSRPWRDKVTVREASM